MGKLVIKPYLEGQASGFTAERSLGPSEYLVLGARTGEYPINWIIAVYGVQPQYLWHPTTSCRLSVAMVVPSDCGGWVYDQVTLDPSDRFSAASPFDRLRCSSERAGAVRLSLASQ